SKEVATVIRGAIVLAKSSPSSRVRRGSWGANLREPSLCPRELAGKVDSSVMYRLLPAPVAPVSLRHRRASVSSSFQVSRIATRSPERPLS
ncbi:hypothetical protein C8T65DRAFT_761734, partial [Cerioporus squamosus]